MNDCLLTKSTSQAKPNLPLFLVTTNYGSLNVIGPHMLIGSGIIRRCALLGRYGLLGGEACHCGGGL